MAVRSTLKGLWGEILNRLGHLLVLSRKDYHAFHNIILPCAGGTAEIDHLIVSPFGIFVIETKHWSGWLLASASDKTWTRLQFRSRIQVRNPLRQNFGHVMAIAELLGVLPEAITPLVAVRGAVFKTPVPPGVVCGGYAQHVRHYRVPRFAEAEVARVLAILRSDRVGRGLFARVRHALRTRSRHTEA